MKQSIQEIIKQRHSCRSYNNESIQEKHRQLLEDFLKTKQVGPLGTQTRFELVAATQDDRQSLKGLGTYGFIKSPTGFIVGAVEQGRRNLEDFGYLLEHIVLTATEVGLGTCWLGGSFSKSGFAKIIALRSSEILPAVIATGYESNNNGNREIIRSQLKMHRRMPMDKLFFDDKFDKPITIESNNPYSIVLEMVRLAPSASNKQPWRIVRTGNAWHFYLQRTKGYGKGTLLFGILRLADLQRVDMGIAMCHFELTARSLGLRGHWIVEDPELKIPEGTEHIVSWVIE
jgi:nitroreductase